MKSFVKMGVIAGLVASFVAFQVQIAGAEEAKTAPAPVEVKAPAAPAAPAAKEAAKEPATVAKDSKEKAPAPAAKDAPAAKKDEGKKKEAL